MEPEHEMPPRGSSRARGDVRERTMSLSADQVAEFYRDGFLIIRAFYSASEIEPIQRAIYRIIGLEIEKHELALERPAFTPERFDAGYQALIARDRVIGAEIYDAVKQIPAFVRLVASPAHEALVERLRATDLVGVAAGGFGIRIDNPGEEKYRAPWHQEYPAQLRGVEGLVFWSPLAAVTEEMGPVEIAVGSHEAGLVPVRTRDPRHPEKTGAYALLLADEEQRLAKYDIVAPLLVPGDLLVMDFRTLHRSGQNRSRRSRWSMQSRLFHFLDPTGIRIGWRGSFAAGVDFTKIHPELVVD